jgi:quercetin dioxygenase-like cupin family protein
LNTAVLVDLIAKAALDANCGPRWAYESTDLDLTLLSWRQGEAIAAHVNDEVDVVLIGVAGTGEITVNGVVFGLAAGHALLIPKGAERAIRCTDDSFSYLSVHQRRRGLWPTVAGRPS